MKVLMLSVLLHGAAAVATTGASFGPQNCVMLTRSTTGSCVISTDCGDADLSKTEFAFDCAGRDGVVRHSFGQGGFDSNEEFDTEVKCEKCNSISGDVVAKPAAEAAPKAVAKVEVPQKVPAAVVFKAKRRHTVKAQAKAEKKTKIWPFSDKEWKTITEGGQPEVARYGPDGCVSTWKSPENHCIMQTKCAKSDISKYEFGLVCVDKVGSPARHLFGKDSFDQEETFDTLIKCDKCLGLEDIPDAVALNGEVVTMSKDISNLKAVMKNISINVQMLNEEVFKTAPAPAAAGPAPAAAEEKKPEAKKAKFLLRRHHHKRREDDDYDDDYEDDRSDDDDSDDGYDED